MSVRRHICLAPRTRHVRRREGTRFPSEHLRELQCPVFKEALLTRLRLRVRRDPPALRLRIRLRMRRVKFKHRGGARDKEATAYAIRGGARNLMATACRRSPAGARARSHMYVNYKNEGALGFAPTQRKGLRSMMTRLIDTRAVGTLSSPHDQRRQRGGRRREGGVCRGADIPEVYWVVTQCERRNPKAWAQS